MVLIDTSIFIAMHRKRSAAIGQRMMQLASRDEAAVCGWVWIEFLGGFASTEKRERMQELLSAYVWLETPADAFVFAAEWRATHRGIGAGDALVAATAFVNDVPLFTLDKGMLTFEKVGVRIELGRP